MMRFSIYDLKIIKEANMPATTLKRQISNMLQNSEVCQANVLRIDPESGEYQVVLEGKLVKEDKSHLNLQ